jgi:DUF2927 family protein
VRDITADYLFSISKRSIPRGLRSGILAAPIAPRHELCVRSSALDWRRWMNVVRTGYAMLSDTRAFAARMIATRVSSTQIKSSADIRVSALARRCAIAAAGFVGLAWMAMAPALAEDSEITTRRSAERIGFSNEEIADGFFKVAFGAEFQVAGGNDHIRRFEAPVRIFVDNRVKADRTAMIAKVVADIAEHVGALDIAVTQDRRAANMVVTLVRHRDLKQTIRAFYGPERAKQIEQRLNPECLSGFAEDRQHRILRAEVILAADGSDFRFFDCAYEELLQSLGPINDDRSVPWTMFNDDVQMGFFDLYDQYLLNILYDARVRPGMTRDEVKAVLPDVLLQVRDHVAQTNPRARAALEAATGVR